MIRKKWGIHSVRRIAIVLFLCLCVANMAFAANVPVRFGIHNGYTRVVFDFPKLVGYYVNKTPRMLEIKFDTPLDVSKPGKLPKALSGMDVSRSDDGMLIVRFAVQAGRVKDYRLRRGIVLDIYPGAGQQKVTPRKTKKEPPQKKKPAKVASPKKDPEKKKDPVPAQQQKPEKDIPLAAQAKTVAKKSAPKAMAAPVPDVERQPVVRQEQDQPSDITTQEDTRIRLSSIEAFPLAVFSRFNNLWIVTNASGERLVPEISGPLAGFLGQPDLLRFEGGVAWRYPMPLQMIPNVERHGLHWRIDLSSKKKVLDAGAVVKTELYEDTQKPYLRIKTKSTVDPLVFEDPQTGDTLYVVPVAREGTYIAHTHIFPDVDILTSAAGLVIRAKRDDLKVEREVASVVVSAPAGLHTSTNVITGLRAMSKKKKGSAQVQRLFDFHNWQRGGLEKLYDNRRSLEQGIIQAETPTDRQAALMQLALLYFANHFGHEALGVMRLIEQEDEEIKKSANFIALKGAASAMSGHYDTARQLLSHAAIQNHPEVRLWQGYVAAASEQWRAAQRAFPESYDILAHYPDHLAIPFTLYIAESALRLGRADVARELLESIKLDIEDSSSGRHSAALAYLQGEAYRQEGNTDKTLKLWKRVSGGLDRLYHAKAALAMTNLNIQKKNLSLEDAIEKLESLRFAWRGDGLEVQILHNLGRLKIRNKNFLSGLQDMSAAVKLSDKRLWDSKYIRQNMRDVLLDLFSKKNVQKVSPLEAVSIYETYGDIMPKGFEATMAKQRYANYLMRIDLVTRAADILEEVLQTGHLSASDIPEAGAQLATAYVRDGRASAALSALKRTQNNSADEALREKRQLIAAQAHAKKGQTQQAVSLLDKLGTENALRMKVDILWRAQDWLGAGKAIESLIPQRAEELNEEQAQMVLNMAAAVKLSGDQKRLQGVKKRFGDMMQKTSLASSFGVLTRREGATTISDRETILKMAGEVDLFTGFLDTYQSSK